MTNIPCKNIKSEPLISCPMPLRNPSVGQGKGGALCSCLLDWFSPRGASEVQTGLHCQGTVPGGTIAFKTAHAQHIQPRQLLATCCHHTCTSPSPSDAPAVPAATYMHRGTTRTAHMLYCLYCLTALHVQPLRHALLLLVQHLLLGLAEVGLCGKDIGSAMLHACSLTIGCTLCTSKSD